MNLLKLCSNSLIRLFVAFVIISSLLVPRGYCQETEDSQIFIAGFNAYQQKSYPTTIDKMNEVLTKYPDTPLRDMALFWLSRAYFKNGNQRDAARYMSQFSKEFPDNPLKSTVDEELLALTARYDRGETLPSGAQPAAGEQRTVVVQKGEDDKARRAAQEKAEQERLAKLQAEEARKAAAETARLAAQKQEQERAAAAEASRQAAAVKEQERQAAAKAEADRVAAAERNRLAAQKAEQERAAAAAEQSRVAAQKAEQEKAAAAAAVAAESARQAAAQKEQQRLAAVKAEQERAAAEASRQAAAVKEQERQAAAKAEQERVAAAEQAGLAAKTSDQERAAAAAAAAATATAATARQAVAQKTSEPDADQVARQQAELVRMSMEKAELKAAKLREAKAAEEAAEAARLKSEAKRKTAEAAEEARLAAIKAEDERAAQEKVLAAQRAVEEAKQKKLAAIKAEQERVAAQQAEQQRLEREKAEKSRQAALQAEQERQAAVKAEQERVAAARAEKERQAASAAEAARVASAKREQERLAAEKSAALAAEAARVAAAQKEQERVATVKAVEQKPVTPRDDQEKVRAEKAALREKAIAQYKSIIEKYPKSASAATAATKLKELGVSVAVPQQLAAGEPVAENAKVLTFEVAQFAGVELNLLAQPQAYPVARRFSVPFELVNRGNGTDSYYLESGFPSEFAAVFAASSAQDTPINQTPSIAPGESFKGVISLLMPASSIDGRRINYPVKVASRFLPEATQSREVGMTASAPLIRAVLKSDKNQPLPGEKVTYRVAILNVGSAAAHDVSFRLNFPPQLEPVDYAAAGFRQEMKAALVIDGLQIKSGESKEFNLAFQLKDDSMAGQELLTRAELNNNLLKTTATFVSNAAYVQQQRGIQVRSGSERLVVIPGQTVNVPFIVTNTGNGREKLVIASSIKGAQDTVIFHDLNRDGIRQANEPVITEVGPLAPKEEASIVMEIKTPRAAADGSEGLAQISFSPEGAAATTFAGSTRLLYSRPVLDLAMSGGDGRLKPGEVASFNLTVTNRGSNLARVVELQSVWPDKLELVAADPTSSSALNSTILWKFKELGAGEKRTIKVSFRVKPGTSMGTNIQVKNILNYEDQLGNRY